MSTTPFPVILHSVDTSSALCRSLLPIELIKLWQSTHCRNLISMEMETSSSHQPASHILKLSIWEDGQRINLKSSSAHHYPAMKDRGSPTVRVDIQLIFEIKVLVTNLQFGTLYVTTQGNFTLNLFCWVKQLQAQSLSCSIHWAGSHFIVFNETENIFTTHGKIQLFCPLDPPEICKKQKQTQLWPLRRKYEGVSHLPKTNNHRLMVEWDWPRSAVTGWYRR